VGVYRIGLDHPKLEWINVRLVESLLFKVEDWCTNPGATYARACESVFRVRKLRVSSDGLCVRGKVGSFQKHNEEYSIKFGFREANICPRFFFFSCSCYVYQERGQLCKHVVAAMLDCCVDLILVKGVLS
jgi:hypothetical protein